MSVTSYVFRATWTISASPDAVFAAVVDVASYPRWWPDVRSVRPCDDSGGTGGDTDTALLICRSTLPLPITVRMRRVEQNRPEGRVAVALTGDLEGVLTGLVVADNGTRLEITQRVVARTTVLRSLSLVARPLLRVNHAMMMRRGLRGLRAHVASQ
ncbi:Polyketide cyclase / dehydrase and lipid transport [Saccharomonospora marina XMU15]|uniref:Polyketide cyclase / dehydrase and lipid transport n=1 Tax=Saccharomonospora marina XMU15 TaxID=882083 RepID=H5WWV1_9PSEU|nr:SRPBCC family protein [Saccharomonospora marina]EHR51714.1 Polyketide cyclase / dehydrase and lipid transport [Saccharomonospora marina XMU15]